MGKIYTKKGDEGETGTFAGRISKADKLAEALGSIDELNCWIGVCRKETSDSKGKTGTELKRIQGNLMTITSILAGSNLVFKIYEVKKLEKLIDKLTEELPILKNFIYPEGYLQLARAVARRAERAVVSLNIQSAKSKTILKYLNRLSDALFVLARYEGKASGIKEEKWKPGF